MSAHTVTRVLLALLAISAAPLRAQQEPRELLQAARYERQVRGDLDAAIRLYERIVSEFAGDRATAARALLELGEVHEILGRAEAARSYSRVLTEYTDQAEPVRLARARLAELAPPVDAGNGATGGIVVRQLWTTPAQLTPHSLSPDGRQVAFIDWGGVRDEALRGHADLAIHDTRTGRARLVTDRPPQSEIDTYIENAIWSFAGTQLAYTLWDTAWTHKALRTVDADGRNDRSLVDNDQFADVRPMAWSEAGRFIAVLIRGWDEALRIGVVGTADGSVRVLKTVGTHAPLTLSVSPDGRFIVYEMLQAEGSQAHDLFLLASDGSVELRVAPHAADDEQPFWTPDGNRIVFLSDRSGQTGLWAVRMEGGRQVGEPELVRPDVGPVNLLGFTRSGGLAYRVARVDADIFTAEFTWKETVALGQPAPLTQRFVGRNLQAAWSPDGSRIAYLSRRNRDPVAPAHLVIGTPAKDEERAFPLPFPNLRQDSRPIWSADGRYVLIEGGELEARTRNPFERRSYRIDAETGEVRQEPHLRHAAGLGNGRVRFASDAQAERLAALGLRIAGQRDIGRYREGDVAPAPGERLLWVREGVKRFRDASLRDIEHLVPEGHMHAWDLSPDGSVLALALPGDFARLTSNVLWTLPVAGVAKREIARVPPEQEILSVRWMPDGQTLLYLTGESEQGPTQAWRVELAGGAPERVDLALDPVQLTELSFHPDGQHVAFTRLTALSELWLMEGFPWQGSARH
jgi:Tol biopolymer transport system component